MNRLFMHGVPSLLGVAAFAALAQAAPAAGSAPAAPAAWHSAFEGYQRFSDEQTLAWPQANEAVQRAGGWRAYAREAARPASAGASGPTPGADAADPNAGHHKP